MASPVRFGITALAFTTLAALSSALRAQSVTLFDLPAQPLADSLKEVGAHTHTNLIVAASLVDGRQAPELKGELTTDQALSHLLAGTDVKYRFLNDTTIVLASAASYGANEESQSRAAGGEGPGKNERGTAETQPPQETQTNSLWGPLRLARADQGSVSNTASLDDQAGPAGQAENQNSKLEVVVVTAEKRAERLQEVPISAVVIGSQTLAEQNHNTLEDLTRTVPNVHVSNAGASNALYIRGIGSDENQSYDQSVGTFIDDIFHGRSRTSEATFLDLDHIEVLKGPQSTFFGNNAIAGALNIVTKKPGKKFDASARALYGEFGQYSLQGAVGGPVTDTFGVRFAATFNGNRGWIKNADTGDYVPRDDNMAGRLTLAYTPSEALEATLKVEGGKNKNTGGYPWLWVNCPFPSPVPPSFSNCDLASTLGIPSGIDHNRTYGRPDQRFDLSTFEDVLTVNYQKWGQTFTSVSGFYNYHFNINFDASGIAAAPLFTIQAPEKYHQFSQELRVASPTGRPIEYLAGLYFQTDHLDWSQPINVSFLSPVIESIPPFAPLVPYLPLGQNTQFSQGERNYSVFGSVSWTPVDRLKLSAGLRGSWVKKDYTRNFFYGTATQVYGGIEPLPADLQALPAAILATPAGSLSGDRSDQAWMPSARIQYYVRPQAMAYFSYSRGFKAGGFNGGDPTGVAANVPFKPEYVDAYEVGLKSEWLDNTLLLNLDVFRSDYRDLQVTTVQLTGGGYVGLVKNAASSRSQGVEFEAEWAASRNFRLSANATYLDSYYISFPNASPTLVQLFSGIQFQDLAGRPTPYSPRWSASATATYSLLLPGEYKFTTELTPFYSSDYFLRVSDESLFQQGGYTRLDGRLSLEKEDGHWVVDVIGKNLTDRDVLMYFGSYSIASKQPRRNVAIQFRYRW